MADIFVGQELILNFTDTDGTDMDTVDFRVDYWAPGNTTNTPDDTIDSGDIVTAPESPIVVITVDKGIINTPSTQIGSHWRFQLIDNQSGVGWTTMKVPVQNLGS